MMAILQPRRREELHQRLASMNLELWCFENALASGAAEASSYSPGAPTVAPELGRWLRTVEELHNGLVALQRGWERSDPMNQPTWINPAMHTAIVVSSGDENTGQVTFSDPSNRNPKGRSFGALVAANEQASFFDAVTESGEMVDINETWVFLYDAREGFVYSELSLPTVMPEAYIENWRERILLPRFDGGANRFDGSADDDPTQDFSFTIQRR
ncbi:hypothetical protein ONR57_06175 [Hoyosella sp. YIM 151337]|uniref:hypothetical protein n=1 Tax=Hoyosella sp. YIM 151337 TaxID=2992742 RepID=UPI002235EFA2|nr:hypothetical protein [Hoyosella sp. YIM 151337]MCW4352879.1 hypothetical protein [Hoyosella sp. YIM 151337]